MIELLKTFCLAAVVFSVYVVLWHSGRLLQAWLEHRRVKGLFDQRKKDSPDDLDDW